MFLRLILLALSVLSTSASTASEQDADFIKAFNNDVAGQRAAVVVELALLRRNAGSFNATFSLVNDSDAVVKLAGVAKDNRFAPFFTCEIRRTDASPWTPLKSSRTHSDQVIRSFQPGADIEFTVDMNCFRAILGKAKWGRIRLNDHTTSNPFELSEFR
jgi:hypothetical protein